MKYTLAIATMLVAAVSTSAFAEGRVAQDQLAEMGLSGMTVLSDAQGAEVRGQGFVYASSVSAAALPGTFSRNRVTSIGTNFAAAATGASADAEVEGGFIVGGFGGGFGPFLVGGYFNLSASVGSSGYAIGAAN